ncbi:hypothetical protein [Paenibacillus sp. P32E]|uniref:hypothetical protein n=1 Tax=Paenibacillus sp. P32E TaxID=1349434 RepID=UPI00093EF067|nr:hypothetical protein [Paenibacillus sp. P32E]OKP87307.1 hypothetical protein A3848_20325 [Paenibacillus sp. P32E]
MNIIIQKTGLKKDEVFFEADSGKGRGIWCGAQVKPGDLAVVEFEIPALLMRWVDIIPAGGGDHSIRLEGDIVVLTGVLDNIEEDGTGCLQLDGELIMFESLGEPMALGSLVEVRTREIRLYPIFL